jgi:hypothetical protein
LDSLKVRITLENDRGKTLSEKSIDIDFIKEIMEKMDEFFGMNKPAIILSILKDNIESETTEENLKEMLAEAFLKGGR